MSDRRPRPTNKPFPAFGLSVLIHGGLAVGVVAVGLWGAGDAEKERVYTLGFDRVAVARTTLEEPEQLEEPEVVEPPVFEPELREAERLPEAPQYDEAGLVPVPRADLPNTREFVFGARPEAPVVEREPVEPVPEVANVPEASPEVAAVPDEAPAAASDTEEVDYERVDGEEPEYPRASVRLGEEGDVVLALGIDAEGFVDSVEIETSSGFRRLDAAAMSAALTWRFAPGTPARFRHTVHFVLRR